MATEKRLIDANVLSMEIDCCSFETSYDCEKVLEIIAEAPTVDAVEVVHGRWIEGEMVIDDGVGGHIYHCSECEDWYHAWTPNYCPNCGAKMDGDGNG